ncbi:MAG TPA: CTP synthase [Ktedonobacteraceae bacterium]|nr:CTP synthase [Ktedonobacteraceae bacterium]
MNDSVRIGLIGDFNPDVLAHVAIPQALALAARRVEWSVETEWLPTPLLEKDAEERLAAFDGLWIVPASPYESMEGALLAVRFARERGVPFLGTCGGFQHALIEYARNVLNLSEADSTESNPESTLPLIAPLSCSLVEATDTIVLQPGSRIAAMYGKSEISEKYHCSFGLNPRYTKLFEASGLRITGFDKSGEARVFDLAGHPFYMGTLFQPERSAFNDVAHPLIVAYMQAVVAYKQASGHVI